MGDGEHPIRNERGELGECLKVALLCSLDEPSIHPSLRVAVQVTAF
jgi:hypothetical protein